MSASRDRYPQWDAQIVELYDSGATIAEIATEIHWSRSFVRNRLRRNGVTVRGRGGAGGGGRQIDPRRVDLARRLRQARKTVPQIAAAMGCSESTVVRWLKLAGVYAPLKATKTRCVKGHELTPLNTYWHDGKRHCKLCKRKARRESMARARARRRATVL